MDARRRSLISVKHRYNFLVQVHTIDYLKRLKYGKGSLAALIGLGPIDVMGRVVDWSVFPPSGKIALIRE